MMDDISRRRGVCPAPPERTPEEADRDRQAAQALADEERCEALLANIPVLSRALMRPATSLDLAALIPHQTQRASIMFRVACWQSGGVYPPAWDPFDSFEHADAGLLRRWLADDGMAMHAALREGRMPTVPHLPDAA